MRNEYEVNYEMYKKWNKDTRFKGNRLKFYICWGVLATFFLAMGCIYRFLFCMEDEFILLYFIFGIFCVFWIFFFPIYACKRQFKLLSDTYGKTNWVRVICFSDENIIVTEESIQITHEYSDIVKIEESDDLIYLRLKNKTIIRVYKSKFTQGNWDECKELIIRSNPALN